MAPSFENIMILTFYLLFHSTEVYEIYSKRFQKGLKLEIRWNKQSKKLIVSIIDDQKGARQLKHQCPMKTLKETETSQFPIGMVHSLERSVKLQIKGFSKGQFRIEVQGMKWDDLKEVHNPDDEASFSESELPEDTRIRFTDRYGWIYLNGKMIIKREQPEFNPVEFKQHAIMSILGRDTVRTIDINGLFCTEEVFYELMRVIVSEINHNQLRDFRLTRI